MSTSYSPPQDQNSALKALQAAKIEKSVSIAESSKEGIEKEGLKDETPRSSGRSIIEPPTIGRGEGDILELKQLTDIGFHDDRMDGSSVEGQEEESLEAKIERLGRERPKQFKSLWAEIVFIFSMSMSQVLTVSHSPLFGVCI